MQREKQKELSVFGPDEAGMPRALSQVFPTAERSTGAPVRKDSGQVIHACVCVCVPPPRNTTTTN